MARNDTAKTETSAEDLTDQIATLRADVSKLTELMGEFGKAKAGEFSDAAKVRMEQVRQEGRAKADAARDQAAYMQAQANDFVQTQPAAALGIAAGLGFLVGFLTSRK